MYYAGEYRFFDRIWYCINIIIIDLFSVLVYYIVEESDNTIKKNVRLRTYILQNDRFSCLSLFIIETSSTTDYNIIVTLHLYGYLYLHLKVQSK